MINIVETRENNRHVQAFKEAVHQAVRTTGWAVLADDDPVMLRQLATAMSKESPLVLAVPQTAWANEEESLKDAIVWSIEELAVHSLVIVGNSRTSLETSSKAVGGSKLVEEAGNVLLARVRCAEQERRRAEERFSQHVQSFVAAPGIGEKLAKRELAIYGLYYRAESGVFTAYDLLNGTFRALINS